MITDQRHLEEIIMTMPARPLGISILAVLSAIGGVLGVLGGLAIFGLGAAAGAAGIGAILALILLVSAFVSLALAYGFWTLKPWAWPVGMGLEILGLVLSGLQVITGSVSISGVLVSVIISAAIIYYLLTPNVKAAFGRSA